MCMVQYGILLLQSSTPTTLACLTDSWNEVRSNDARLRGTAPRCLFLLPAHKVRIAAGTLVGPTCSGCRSVNLAVTDFITLKVLLPCIFHSSIPGNFLSSLSFNLFLSHVSFVTQIILQLLLNTLLTKELPATPPRQIPAIVALAKTWRRSLYRAGLTFDGLGGKSRHLL